MERRMLAESDAVRRQYADGETLDARSSIYAWQSPRYDLVGEVVGRLPSDARTVLDVGCGRGQYLARLADRGRPGFGVDLSPGLAGAARLAAGRPTIVGDAGRLPVADGSVDAALAMHMLYHLPEPTDGLHELRRVVQPGGTVVILLNGQAHFTEHFDLLRRAIGLEGAIGGFGAHFTLEDRLQVEGVFGPVEVVELDGVITLDRPEPLLAYLDSALDFYDGLGDRPWPEVRSRYAALLDRKLADDGTITVTTRSGLLIARA